MPKRATLNGSPRIVVRDEDYDEERAAPVRILNATGRARLRHRRSVTVTIENDINSEGNVYFGIELETPVPNDGGDVSMFGLTLDELLTISFTLTETIARAKNRGIVP